MDGTFEITDRLSRQWLFAEIIPLQYIISTHLLRLTIGQIQLRTDSICSTVLNLEKGEGPQAYLIKENQFIKGSPGPNRKLNRKADPA